MHAHDILKTLCNGVQIVVDNSRGGCVRVCQKIDTLDKKLPNRDDNFIEFRVDRRGLLIAFFSLNIFVD